MSILLTSIHPEIQKKFKQGFMWTLIGSVLYETCKIIHCLLLLKVLPTQVYGIMGSVFSLVYLVMYIADMGATNSLPPFFKSISQSKLTFKNFLLQLSLIPHTPLLLLCAAAGTFFAWSRFDNNQLPHLLIIPILIIMEAIRTFLRVLLHMTFQSKKIIIVELVIFFLYVSSIWIPYLFITGYSLNLNAIFIPHLLDSTLAVAFFIAFTYQYHKTLPNDIPTEQPIIIKRLVTTRIFNYLLRVSRNMFTSNFLTPLFALKFGLESAGLFYFASILANATQAIIKSVIGYSGGALLANIKDSNYAVKKEAFDILSQKILMIASPIIIFFILNHRLIITLSQSHDATSYTISLCLLFLVISFSEFFFILYEQFYIIEEAANKLFIFKLFELIIFYSFISSSALESPISTLIGMIFIRLFSLVIIAINAYYVWKIKPNFKMNIKYIVTWILISLGLSLAGPFFSFLK